MNQVKRDEEKTMEQSASDLCNTSVDDARSTLLCAEASPMFDATYGCALLEAALKVCRPGDKTRRSLFEGRLRRWQRLAANRGVETARGRFNPVPVLGKLSDLGRVS